MGKPVKIFGSATGSTTEANFGNLTVDGKATTSTYYVVKKGFKLKIFDVVVSSEQATWFRIYVSPDAGTTWNSSEEIYLASAGVVHVPYKMPWIIEAVDNDYYVEPRYIQATAGPARISINAELCRLEE